jgi:hypothetical protein
LDKVEHILLNDTQLILNPVYKNIGFDKINDDIFATPGCAADMPAAKQSGDS